MRDTLCLYLGGIYLATHTDVRKPGMVRVQLWGYRCERCEHEWLPRGGKNPKVCPKCKSPYWDTPRKSAKGAAK